MPRYDAARTFDKGTCQGRTCIVRYNSSLGALGLYMRCSIYGKPGLVVVGLAVAVSTTACGSASTRARGPFTDVPTTVGLDNEKGSPKEIVRAEILSYGSTHHTAMALIRRLRPAWLRARGQKSFAAPSAKYPVVYIDEIRYGGLGTLDRITSGEIRSMQFISMADATTRWGTGHPSGVINVVTTGR